MPKLSMDPAFASLIKKPREVLRDARIVRETISAARQGTRPRLSGIELEVKDFLVPFADSENGEVPVRIYRPKNAADALPALLYLHGGGFFCGDLYSEELQCSHYALHARCAVVCVEYRLAPEDPFPAALTDCYQVLEYLWNGSQELNLDRDLLAVGGSSAGANLAAAIALLARDRRGPTICFQMLLVPALDDRLETPSARAFTDVPDFARPEAVTMWGWYLGQNIRGVSPYAAPARAENLSNLPAAYILCAGLDPLRDDGLNYARRLTEAKVAVELHLAPSIPHGFASIPTAAISVRLLKEQVEVLRGAFRQGRIDCDPI
jgi:acetyl esterase